MYTAQGKMHQQELLQQYLPLVKKHALNLKTRLPAGVDMDDLIQAGSIGLLDALTRYDQSLGIPFGTFAAHRIRGAMIDELRTRDWAPRRVRRYARLLEDTLHRLEQSLGRPPGEREIAAAMGMSLGEYQQLLWDINGSHMLAIDQVHEDTLEHDEPHGRNPLNALLDERNHSGLIRAIENLPERERLLMVLYHQEKLNMREIGLVLEISESRVCQLHSLAIARLRASLAA
ncbi:RNA polymerase sigma factor FliA [Pantoea sp. Tr-811]|uniref:RNA polymerase sigma factor FliA n=1 Tax=unclassified Pantoea TaxID=2630326 RepID=UPI001423D843|nr:MULTISPECIES: RNA polymerase sigma factor FliA [unclassified Pantoea]NIE76513.1 RNA polymerase sigma factor FliA [Pantoea sp. Ap-967]NIF26506.1 RNA polymerase sigma factor FliA [Pantoea sp. Tr-811]